MANRYWVGGTAAWDGTAGTKWALTSGGAGGQAIPTSADDVFFDAASGAVTCTISTGNTGAKSITCTGFTGTLAGTATLSVSGSITLSAGMTFTYTGVVSLLATGTITSSGKSFGGLTINGSGITVTLGDAATIAASGTTTLTQGTLTLNGFTLSTGIFSSSNTNTRSIAFGSVNIALTSTTAGATVLEMVTATGFTFTGTGGFTRNQAATATVRFGTTGGTAANAPNLTVNTGSSTLTIENYSLFKNVNFTGSTCTVNGFAYYHGNLTLASGGTYTNFFPAISFTQTFNSLGKQLFGFEVDGSGVTATLGGAITLIQDCYLTLGTIALNGFTLSCRNFISSNTNTREIQFGTSNIALTSSVLSTVLQMDTATNFTFTGTGGFTRNQASIATVVFGTTGGTASNAPNLTVNTGSNTLTITNGSIFRNLIFTGSTCTASGQTTLVGNLTLASGGTYTGLSPTFDNGTSTVTSNGKTLSSVILNSATATVSLADAMTSNSSFTLTAGTFNTQNFSVTSVSFSTAGTGARTLNMGSSTWTITGNGWTVSTTTNLVINAGTSTISMTSASAKTFAGNGLTYYNINQGGAGALTITGSNTFSNITNTYSATGATSILFTAGTTSTFTNWNANGAAGRLLTIGSATAASHTLSKASGTVNADFLSISYSTATGGAAWSASNSTDGGNNTGWVFLRGAGSFIAFFM